MFKERLTKEVILYLVFGVLTTVVNIAVYLLCSKLIDIDVVISNILAWFVSVLFAYVTNRKWVFESSAVGFSSVMREAIGFFAGRIGTGVMDTLLMYLTVEILHYDDLLMKILVNVIVIVANYLISKFLIFRTKESSGGR